MPKKTLLLLFQGKIKSRPSPPSLESGLNIKIPFREGLIVLLNLAHFLGNFKVIFTKFKKLRMFPVMKLWLCMGIKWQERVKTFPFQPTNNVYDFLSGVKVTNETKFIALDNPSELR